MKDVTKIGGWFGLIAAILSVAGSIVGCTLWVSRRFGAEEERMAKIESAIKVLNSEPSQSQEYRELIKELLAEHAVQQTPFQISRPIEAQRHYPFSPTMTIQADSSADAPAAKPAAPTKKANADTPKEQP